MTEEELNQAREQLEADRAALKRERDEFEQQNSVSKLVSKYKAQVKNLQAQITDRDKAIADLLDGGTPPEDKGIHGGMTAEFKKLLRL